ncbi:MAG TPA: hypothetical protein VH592_15005 [Gemmataceae bacterium]|jgi:hypothetical protein
MSHHKRTPAARIGLLLAATLLSAIVLPIMARAEDKRAESSLDLMPADAAFYGAILRNRDQVAAVANSKTWARLIKLPYFQMGLSMLKQQYEQSDDFVALRQWIAQEENRDLVEMLTDAVSTEIFCYGAGNCVDFVSLLQQLNAGRYSQMMQLWMDSRGNDQKGQQYASVRGILRSLAENPNKIKFPDLVIGFKIKDVAKAEAQIKRLEPLGEALAAWQPIMQGRFKRAKVGDSSFFTVTLDGSMVPWDQIPWEDLEEKAGEFEGLRKSLKKLKLTISLGVRQGFLLLAFGTTTDGVAQLGGEGPRLTSRPELKPLLGALGKRLTGIGYSSKALAAQTSTTKEDIDNLAAMAGPGLEAAGIPEQQRKAILKDVSALAADLKKSLTAPGASLSFSYLTPRGYEGYSYQYGEFPDRDSSQALSLLDHMGGDPILAVVGRSKGTLGSYQTLSKWIKTLYGHVEPVVLEKLGEQEKQKYQEVAKLILPLLRRGDDITSKMLLPSLADEQAGFALDAKWKSRQWHQQMPPSEQALPMPELAFLVGVSDRALLETAMKSYAKVIEDALKLARENAPPDARPPFTKLPEPQVKEVQDGKLYIWHLPQQWMLDRRVAPTAAVSEKVGLIALSAEHAERLLTSNPLKVEGGPLADRKRPLTGASYINWAGFVDALSPWLMFALEQARLEKALPGSEDKKDDTQKQKQEIVRHVRAVLDALKAIRVSTSATYIQDGALITHSETIVRDE